MALDDIVFAVTSSAVGTQFTIELPVSGSQGSPLLIEAQTVYFEKRLFGKETVAII